MGGEEVRGGFSAVGGAATEFYCRCSDGMIGGGSARGVPAAGLCCRLCGRGEGYSRASAGITIPRPERPSMQTSSGRSNRTWRR